MGFACWLSAEHRIERDQFEDVDGLELELGRDPRDGFVRDETEMLLPQVEQGQGGAPFGDGIVGDRLVNLG